MRKLYNNVLKSIENLIVYLQINKMRISENFALYKKRNLLNNVKWSKATKKEFDKFWKKNYGKKIKNGGHKLFESINAVYHKEYMPDFLFATKVEPFFNSYFYAKLYADKSLTEILYSKCTDVVFPKTFLVNSGGVFYDSNRKIISVEEAKTILDTITEAVIKPTIGGNSGKGVMVCSFENGFDKQNNYSIYDLLKDNNKDFIVQERMMQHPTISAIYPSAVNTIRTITYILDGKVYCADLAFRIGSGGSSIDNIHAGGLVIGINNDGTLLKYAYKLGYSESKQRFEKHPDTNLIFEKHIIVGTEKIVEVVKKLHGLTPHVGMISWDFMITNEGQPALIEANYWGQSVWFPQIVHGKPIFGDNTKKILELIRVKKNG